MSGAMISTLVSALLSAGISAVVSLVVVGKSLKSASGRDLENELSDILEIGIEHPFFEQRSFTDSWRSDLATTDNRYAAYDLYATLVFNHLEKRCRFHRFKIDKVEKELDVSSWVKVHAMYWRRPTEKYENILGYDTRFINIVNSILKRKEA